MAKKIFWTSILFLLCALLVSCGNNIETEQQNEQSVPTPSLQECKNHTFGVWEVISEATCTNGGEARKVCEKCGYVKKQPTLELGHDLRDGICQACGYNVNVSYNENCQHVIGENPMFIEPTCINDGATITQCTKCGMTFSKVEPMTNIHEEIIIPEREASCSEEGSTEHRYCLVCGKVLMQSQRLPSLPHRITVEEAVKPTCQKSGWSEGQHCYVCRRTVVSREILPTVGHRYLDGICMMCGISEPEAKIKKAAEACEQALGNEHVINEWLVISEATCQKEGMIRGRCSVCRKYIEVTSQKIPHVYCDGFCIMCEG